MKTRNQKQNAVVSEREAGNKRNGTRKQQKTDEKYIALFGLFCMGNYGNDGTLKATLQLLHEVAPEEKLFCICSVPDLVKQSFGIDGTVIAYGYRPSTSGRAVTRLRKAIGKLVLLFHAFWQLRKVKLLIIPGGGPLDDFCAHPLSKPLDLMVWTGLARLMGIKVVFASVGAGPMHNPISRVFLMTAARAAHYRSYRDEKSKAFMAGIGFDVSRDPVFPDLTFCLPAPPNETSGETPLTIGVGVMAYHGWQQGPERVKGLVENYARKMVAYIDWLLDQGYHVRVMIGDDADKDVVEEIVEAVRDMDHERFAESVTYEPAGTLDEIMCQMAKVDLAVATRFHNVVCALKMGKPTISIAYAHKNDILLAEMGLEEFCHHIDSFDVERLKKQTEALLSQRAAVGPEILETCSRFKDELGGFQNMLHSLIRDEPLTSTEAKAEGYVRREFADAIGDKENV